MWTMSSGAPLAATAKLQRRPSAVEISDEIVSLIRARAGGLIDAVTESRSASNWYDGRETEAGGREHALGGRSLLLVGLRGYFFFGGCPKVERVVVVAYP